MDVQTKQKIERAVKPLVQWKSAIFYSLKSGVPPDKSADHPYRPSPSDHSAITSSPLVPTFFLLIIALLILSSFPVRHWLDTAGNLPTLAQIFSISREKQSNALPKADEIVSVWTKKQFGFYYCQGDVLYGRKPGELMTQAEALSSGYQPSTGQYCIGNKPNETSADGLSLRVGRTLPATDSKPWTAQ